MCVCVCVCVYINSFCTCCGILNERQPCGIPLWPLITPPFLDIYFTCKVMNRSCGIESTTAPSTWFTFVLHRVSCNGIFVTVLALWHHALYIQWLCCVICAILVRYDITVVRMLQLAWVHLQLRWVYMVLRHLYYTRAGVMTSRNVYTHRIVSSVPFSCVVTSNNRVYRIALRHTATCSFYAAHVRSIRCNMLLSCTTTVGPTFPGGSLLAAVITLQNCTHATIRRVYTFRDAITRAVVK